jgi:hypothetical protein
MPYLTENPEASDTSSTPRGHEIQTKSAMKLDSHLLSTLLLFPGLLALKPSPDSFALNAPHFPAISILPNHVHLLTMPNKQQPPKKKQVSKQLKSPPVPRPLAFISRHIIYPSSLISGPVLASQTPMSIIVMPWCESCFSCIEQFVDVCLQEGTDAVYGQASLDIYLSFF